MVSCVQSLHGLFETSFFDVEDEDFEGPTVGVVVAERLETVAVLEDDISSTTMDDGQWWIGVQQLTNTNSPIRNIYKFYLKPNFLQKYPGIKRYKLLSKPFVPDVEKTLVQHLLLNGYDQLKSAFQNSHVFVV
jgi:hypothetical protein